MKRFKIRSNSTVFDPQARLYRGEQSFLDWREQSYPDWAKDEPLCIGRSKALSTNILHYKILDLASQLAEEQGLLISARKESAFFLLLPVTCIRCLLRAKSCSITLPIKGKK
jgi:hypothetical protein